MLTYAARRVSKLYYSKYGNSCKCLGKYGLCLENDACFLWSEKSQLPTVLIVQEKFPDEKYIRHKTLTYWLFFFK